MTFKTKWLAVAAYAVLAIPVLLFFVGWLRWYIGVPAVLVLVAGLVWLIRKDYWGDKDSIRLPILHVALSVVVFGGVVALSGVAGIGVSGYDIPWRNAIFNDLMQYDWPVAYENGNAMVYYCAFWLLAALPGKLFGATAGYVALWAFITLVMTLSYLLILALLKITTPGKMWLATTFLVLWSGMHLLAAALISAWGWNLYDYPLLTDGSAYLDWFYNGESFNWYYRSNLITLGMTYNQLMIWLVVPLMLLKRSTHSYMALGLLLMPYSPWGFIGLIPLLIVAAMPWIIEQVRGGKALSVVKAVFSPANVAALVTIVPIFALYFLASSRTGAGASAGVISYDMVDQYVAAGMHYTTQTGSFGFLSFDRFGIRNIAALVFFWIMEFGLYMALIGSKFRRKPLFWAVLVVLMVVPLMWAGTVGGRDFCMNASLSSLFVLMIMVLGYVKDEVCGKPLSLKSLCLVVALVLAFTGGAFSLLSKASVLKNEHTLAQIDDSIGTLADKPYEDYANFLIEDTQGVPFYDLIAQ